MRVPNTSGYNKYNEDVNDQSYKQMYVEKKHNPDLYNEAPTIEYDIEIEKEKTKLIKLIERFVRSSFEYGELRTFLSNEMDMSECSYFNGVSSDDSRRIKIEIHHAPFTLYDIVDTVINKHFIEKGKVDIYDVTDEVLELHYRGMVGLIPLCESVHSAVHNGYIFIPVNYVFGYLTKFIDEYGKYIEKSNREAFYENVRLSSEFVRVPDILKPKYVYFDEGFSLPRSDFFKVKKEL